MDVRLDHEFTLNPDGSGKVDLDWRGPAPDDGNAVQELMRGEVEGAQGIDVWGSMDVSVKDGCLAFKATAYFRDIGGLRFRCQGFHSNLLDFVLSRDEAGNVIIEHRRTEEDMGRGPSREELQDEEGIRRKLAGEREKFAQIRGFIEGLFGSMKLTARVNLPGRIGVLANGQLLSERCFGVEMDGQKILGILDRLMADDELAIQAIRQGLAGPEDLQRLLGVEGPTRAVTKGEVELAFDYEAETEAARAWFAEFSASMGSLAEPRRPPVEGPPLENARIIAAKVVSEADGDRDLTPLSQNFTGLSLTVAGDLPGGIIELQEAHVVKAVTDGGQDLVEEKGGDI